MGEWAGHGHYEKALVVVLEAEIGVVGWFAGGVVVGSGGLGGPQLESRGGITERLLRLQPEYLMLHAKRSELRMLRARDDLSRQYYPIRRFSLLGETDLEPALADLSEDCQSDYLLFRRRQ